MVSLNSGYVLCRLIILVNRLRIVWEYQIHDDDPEELPINFICRITGKFHEETLTINQYIVEWVDLESLIDDLIT